MISEALLIWVIPIILSLITVYLVYKIYTFNRLNKAWLFVALGFLLILLLRVLTGMSETGLFPGFFVNWHLYDPILRILNNICFIIGFWGMLKDFEGFEIVEKKVGKVITGKRK